MLPARKPVEAVSKSEGHMSDSAFLAAVGRAVRERREQHGITRRDLSERAEVSERYLAQLESGEGNASIVLLRRVAVALGARIQDLLDVGDLAPRFKRIALIGLRGAGKSTLGQALARQLQRPFIELDREIESEAGMSSSELFQLSGQAGYRRVERRCLERIIEGQKDMVLAVGGGVVSEAESYELLLANCFTIWIQAAPEEHMSRVIAQGDLRPMTGNNEAMEDLRKILASRESLYGRADSGLNTSGQSVQQSLAALKRLVKAATANDARRRSDEE